MTAMCLSSGSLRNWCQASKKDIDALMRFLGNIIWVLFGGFVIALLYFVVGLVMCVTIVGIPFGVQLFKLGAFALWPFGREMVFRPSEPGCLGAGLPFFRDEPALDPAGMVGDRVAAPGFRVAFLHHDHRHPFRGAALQDGVQRSFPVRAQYPVEKYENMPVFAVWTTHIPTGRNCCWAAWPTEKHPFEPVRCRWRRSRKSAGGSSPRNQS